MWLKCKEWIRRYAGAEIAGTLGALLGVGFVEFFFAIEGLILTAYIATIGENVGFYGWMLRKEHQALSDEERSVSVFSRTSIIGRSLFIEFGIAELLDSGFIRPASMYLAMQFFGDPLQGAFVGKILADVLFYIPAIVCFEIRKIRLNKKLT
jgi:hypothetical protein